MRHVSKLSVLFCAALAFAACGTTSRTSSTLEGPAYEGAGFSNVLVLGIADNYNNRATFERTLVKEIESDSVAATAHYSLTKMDDEIDRASIEKLVEEGGFDAVLITRVLNREFDSKLKVGSSSTKVTRKDADRVADLFRYEYQELNEPVSLTTEINVIISSELFSTASRSRVWAIESDISDAESVGLLVLDAAAIVARQLRRDNMLAE